MQVIIIGVGMAGLSAALELKKSGVEYLLLEATEEAGGRAVTRRLPSGTVADLGAQWLHGKNNPLQKLLEYYYIPYARDKADALYIYKDGKLQKSSSDAWLKNAINQQASERIEKGSEPDMPVTALAKDHESRELLSDFALMWNGIEPPREPSAYEFVTDESTPGGLLPEGGMGKLIDAMTGDIGREHIRFASPVEALEQTNSNVRVAIAGGEEFTARHVIFTPSVAVIQSGMIRFYPTPGEKLQRYLSGLIRGKMNKIVIELKPEFFKERKIPANRSYEMLDENPPHFCHVRSNGLPLINLFVSGDQAREVEDMPPSSLLEFAQKVLAPAKEMRGFEQYLAGEPLVSRWIGNPYTQCSYFSCLPGAKRSGPILDNRICFCGDSFDEIFPASLAGAYLSGQKAAQLIAGLVRD